MLLKLQLRIYQLLIRLSGQEIETTLRMATNAGRGWLQMDRHPASKSQALTSFSLFAFRSSDLGKVNGPHEDQERIKLDMVSIDRIHPISQGQRTLYKQVPKPDHSNPPSPSFNRGVTRIQSAPTACNRD